MADRLDLRAPREDQRLVAEPDQAREAEEGPTLVAVASTLCQTGSLDSSLQFNPSNTRGIYTHTVRRTERGPYSPLQLVLTTESLNLSWHTKSPTTPLLAPQVVVTSELVHPKPSF